MLLALLLALAGGRPPAQAQAETPAYWRYDAPGRLDQIVVADVDGDGVDQIVVAAEGGNVILVASDGQKQWPANYEAPGDVLQLAVADVLDSPPGGKEIVVGTAGQLILLDSAGNEVWQRPVEHPISALAALDGNGDGREEILVALRPGLLRLYDAEGQVVWQYSGENSPLDEGQSKIRVADLDGDGRSEVAFTYFIPRREGQGGFSRLVVLDDGGQARWEPRPVSGRALALTFVAFDPQGRLDIAVGTSLNQVYLFNSDGHPLWLRTPNRPVTSLLEARLDGGPALVVGTAAGTVIAYDQHGRRIWSDRYSDTPDRRVLTMSAGRKPTGDDRLLIILSPAPGGTEAADGRLLDSDGRVLEEFPSTDTTGLSRLLDLNHDGNSEVLLVSFATLELLDPGIGVREYSSAWEYRLQAQPQTALAVDLDRDGQDELLVGTSDGRLLLLPGGETAPLWEQALGGVVTAVAVAGGESDDQKGIAVVHNNRIVGVDGLETFEGWLRLLRPDGRQISQVRLPTTITSLLVGDINDDARPEIAIGTTDGHVIAYSEPGKELWRGTVNGSVSHLALVRGEQGTEIVVSSRANELDRFNGKGGGPARAAAYLHEISTLRPIPQEGELVAQLLVGVEDGTVRGLNWRGIQLWALEPPLVGGLPELSLPADNSFVIATDESELLRVDYGGKVLWRQSGLGRITSLFWGDLNEDGRPDVAVGNRDGQIHLLSEETGQVWASLEVSDNKIALVYLAALRSRPDGPAELVTIAQNGVVRLFRSQANRPPLLVRPRTEVDQGKYNITITVIDPEHDPVAVTLDLYEPALDRWTPQQQRTATNGRDDLTWFIDPPEGAAGVRYRFLFDDGSYQGYLEPAVGPPPIEAGSFINATSITLVALVVAVAFAGYLTVRQAGSPAGSVRRFYQRVSEQPALTLDLLETEYDRTRGSPDFLLNLAGKARQHQNSTLASLADGLFLLIARPSAALPIINHALKEAEELEATWHHLRRWQLTYQLGEALLAAPSVTELSLLRPQLVHLLTRLDDSGRQPTALADLLPVLTSLRDSERVDLVEDHLVYLNEATGLLQQLEATLQDRPLTLYDALAATLARRWSGLVNAEIEELRGRAKLVIQLKTKRVVPEEESVVALEIKNSGRAPAEHIVIELENDPAYKVVSQAQVIPFLPAGRTRLVNFTIHPQTADRFRLACNVRYDDRHSRDKKMAFADRVYVLPPVREFAPIANPYSPGTPLRRNSSLFYGREDLFAFIIQNVGRLSQQNVLILVGQRRTGKTSALLQLEQRLPEHMLPVYIDCQSLGVVPGMAALFHDLAWTIADALRARDYEIAVAPPADWQDDPGGRFQRHFIPAARSLLSAGTLLVLIFDEFEAFENLVADGHLPATLFTYLRHLMQHGEGMSFVFVGTRQLEEMSTDYWSVLFNIALYRQIGFLTEAAAIRLITEPVAPNLVYDDLAIDKILRVTAGHPYFLQLVCYTLVNRANQQERAYVTISDVNAGLEEMLRLGEMHFAYLWQRSTQTERALLTAVAHLMDRDVPFHPADLVQYLAEYGIRLNPTEVTVGLNRLVEREIMREISDEATTLYELRIGLVGLWAAQNKSLSKLYDGRTSRRERSKALASP